jgi:hypothetical protein
MPYQYVRESLTAEEADRLSNACDTPTEKLVVWTLLDTGLRVDSQVAALHGMTTARAHDRLNRGRFCAVQAEATGTRESSLTAENSPARSSPATRTPE